MARKSKSSKNHKKSDSSDKVERVETAVEDTVTNPESSGSDDPVVIEAEATEVTPSEEISPEADVSASEEIVAEAEEVLAEAETELSSDDTAEIAEDAVEASDDEVVVEETASDDTLPVPEEVVVAPEPKKASAVPMFLGGAIAAGLGYLAAIFSQPSVDTTALTESITANGTQIEAMTSDIAALQEAEAPTVDLSPIEGTLGDLTTQLEGLTVDLAAVRDDVSAAVEQFEGTANVLSDRITVLETAGPGESAAAEATEQDLAAFRAELQRIAEEAEAQVAASMERASEIEQTAMANAAAAEEAAKQAEQEAADAAALAERETAIATVMTALESGQGYGDALAVLGDVPEALSANAETGVTTVVELQQSFADAARVALAEAATIPQDASAGDRLAAFLSQQTNARSLTPKEGDSTDAVLSRGEAMMKQGDVSAALAELDALDETAKAAMQTWLDQATTRQAALEAAAQLNATN